MSHYRRVLKASKKRSFELADLSKRDFDRYHNNDGILIRVTSDERVCYPYNKVDEFLVFPWESSWDNEFSQLGDLKIVVDPYMGFRVSEVVAVGVSDCTYDASCISCQWADNEAYNERERILDSYPPRKRALLASNLTWPSLSYWTAKK